MNRNVRAKITMREMKIHHGKIRLVPRDRRQRFLHCSRHTAYAVSIDLQLFLEQFGNCQIIFNDQHVHDL